MRDSLFGDIDENGRAGTCSWSIFSAAVTTPLAIDWYDDEEIEPAQRDAYVAFNARKDEMCARAEAAIFGYYIGNMPEYRERFGPELASKWAPHITCSSELARLVTPTLVYIKRCYADPTKRVVGLLFDCSWDTSLGLAVKFVDEQVREVGPQDIVL